MARATARRSAPVVAHRQPRPGGARAPARRAAPAPTWLLVLAAILGVAGLLAALAVRGGREGAGALATLKTADFHALAFSPADPEVAFFGHHNGVQRSADGGRSWAPLVDRRDFDAMGLAVSRADPRRIYLAGHDVFQVSTDGGASWQPVAHDLPGADIHAFAMHPDDADRLHALVVGQGVFTSGDGGRTWRRLEGQLPADVLALASAGGSPETLYAGSMSAGVLRSADGGRSWAPLANGLGARQIMALAVDPAARQTIYAGVEGGVYKSIDGGLTWGALPFPGENAVALAVSPARPDRVLAIGVQDRQGLVYRSDDGGRSWGAGR